MPDDPATPPDPDRTEDLAAHAADDVHGAFDRLYTRLAPALYAWAELRIPRKVATFLEPQEVLQETWVRALSRFESYDPQTGGFRPWIFRIATLVLHEGYRRVARREGRGEVDLSAGPRMDHVPAHVTTISRRAARDEGVRAFAAEVAHLADEERRLLLWRGLEGLPYGEVAERLGVEQNTAMKRWQRLRESLGQRGHVAELLEV